MKYLKIYEEYNTHNFYEQEAAELTEKFKPLGVRFKCDYIEVNYTIMTFICFIKYTMSILTPLVKLSETLLGYSKDDISTSIDFIIDYNGSKNKGHDARVEINRHRNINILKEFLNFINEHLTNTVKYKKRIDENNRSKLIETTDDSGVFKEILINYTKYIIETNQKDFNSNKEMLYKIIVDAVCNHTDILNLIPIIKEKDQELYSNMVKYKKIGIKSAEDMLEMGF